MIKRLKINDPSSPATFSQSGHLVPLEGQQQNIKGQDLHLMLPPGIKIQRLTDCECVGSL